MPRESPTELKMEFKRDISTHLNSKAFNRTCFCKQTHRSEAFIHAINLSVLDLLLHHTLLVSFDRRLIEETWISTVKLHYSEQQ